MPDDPEDLPGLSTSDARVHRGPPEPERLRGPAPAERSGIHPGPRQGRHLAHEADAVAARASLPRLSPRFVAFSTIDDEPWEAGADVDELLGRVRALAALGIGHVRYTEILDCGAEAGDVVSRGTLLPEARARFPAVFRGDDGGPGLPSPTQASPET